jgi:hypothetical protein
MEVTGIDVGHPFRDAKPEREALDHVFRPVAPPRARPAASARSWSGTTRPSTWPS